jgi:hypothetical protein
MASPVKSSLEKQKDSLTLNLSSAGLHRIEALPIDKDFAFIVCGSRYQCSIFSASFLSPRVFRLVCADPTIDFIDIGKRSAAVFESLLGFLSLSSVSVAKESLNEALLISRELENDELVSIISSELYDSIAITVDNVIRVATSRFRCGLDISGEVSFMASHFYEFESDILSSVGLEIGERIVRSSSLCLMNEDSLLEAILSSGHESLNCYVECEYLSDSGIDQYLEFVTLDQLTPDTWASICRRLRHHVEISHDIDRFSASQRRRIVTHHYLNDPFDGILKSLRSSCGENPHTGGEVVISASSTMAKRPHQVVDYGWNNYWYSNDEANSWLQIDFKNRRVLLTHYSLNSNKAGSNYIRKWVLEASDDEKTWETLDSRDTDELVGRSRIKIFPIISSARYFRYVRIRQTGTDSNNHHTLVLTNLELFGNVKE